MILPTFDEERALAGQGYGVVIGVDEVGRGPLVGPVVAGAAVFRGTDYDAADASVDKLWHLVRDSKSLSERQRAAADAFVRSQFHVGIGLCDHETIDRINILEASFLAMKKAIAALERELPHAPAGATIVVVDGDKEIPNMSMPQRAVPSGDKLVMSVAAASIVAKVVRDDLMLALHAQYPQYGFDRHKGYGTAAHMAALAKYGPTPLHRRSFKPVLRILRELAQYGGVD